MVHTVLPSNKTISYENRNGMLINCDTVKSRPSLICTLKYKLVMWHHHFEVTNSNNESAVTPEVRSFLFREFSSLILHTGYSNQARSMLQMALPCMWCGFKWNWKAKRDTVAIKDERRFCKCVSPSGLTLSQWNWIYAVQRTGIAPLLTRQGSVWAIADCLVMRARTQYCSKGIVNRFPDSRRNTIVIHDSRGAAHTHNKTCKNCRESPFRE